MNKIYRLKFSKRLNQLVAVSEITTGHDRHSGSQNEIDTSSILQIIKFLKLKPLAGVISLLSFGFATQTAMANGLQGMEVVNGSASMSINGKNTTITNSPDAIINWKQFNINQDELVRFVQENSNSAVFNRVTSDQISQLKGALNSNGHVFLINPNGIVMGKDAVINAAGFTASTLNISDKDLKARNFNFEQAKDKAMAQIVNNGLISVSKNGSVNLIGGSVKNNGVIKVEDGNILLLAGQKVTISDITNPTITYSVVAPKNEAVNLGTIFAKNGKIQMHAGSVVNKGTLNANSVRKDKSGVIILSAKEGEANIDGTVTLNNANFKAGSLTITGKKVVLNSGAKVELTGKQGGTVYIGGDERGQGKIQLAEKTEIKQGASVNVSGSEKGGKAIVWGDRAQVDGKITAKGKDKKNSGFVETSGKYLGVGKTAKVEAKEWLLDPYNVRIVSSPTPQSAGVSNSPTPITITGSNKDVTILNTTIETALNAGTDVTITTAEATSVTNVGGDGNFTVEADIVKSGMAAEANLTMIANHTFTQNTGTSIKATAGKLNLNVTAHKDLVLKGEIDTNQGTLNITTKGNATLEGATLKANGTLTITAENTGNSDRTLNVSNVNLTGYGTGLTLNVSDKAKIKGTWGGDINVTGNVSYEHTLADHTKESHHDWAANLTVDNGKFTFSDLNNHNQIQDGVTQNEPILKISKDVKFDVKNSTDTVTFDVKQHGGSAGTNSLLDNKNSSDISYISKLATHINSNLTVRGGGSKYQLDNAIKFCCGWSFNQCK
ncbi:filamentous hemagglutinin N-terminal domain-containing protein [Haemophilus influenzae]|uniref:two-partner secretion domain-containing protein n=1 Tax=Haemophilus influenzae TaxID=727 RepID=UPI000D01D328|nr:filamentous hemagglutinin N-terminal domain-containing protein [Haemophilus influenzae]PRM82782.1 Heme/hemopexin-binding protein precursor [Haemophilus influenzae]